MTLCSCWKPKQNSKYFCKYISSSPNCNSLSKILVNFQLLVVECEGNIKEVMVNMEKCDSLHCGFFVFPGLTKVSVTFDAVG